MCLFLGLRRAHSPAGTLLPKLSPSVDGGSAVEDAPFGGILISSAICVYFWEACVPGWPLPRDSLMETTAWAPASGSGGPPRNSSAPPLCGKGQRVEGISMLKQICRCCSPSSLHALTLEAAAQLKSGRGGWCEYVKQRKCEFPCTYFVIGSLFSLKPQSTILYLEMCRCEAASVAVCSHRWSGHFIKHSCDLASLLLCDWLSFQ